MIRQEREASVNHSDASSGRIVDDSIIESCCGILIELSGIMIVAKAWKPRTLSCSSSNWTGKDEPSN